MHTRADRAGEQVHFGVDKEKKAKIESLLKYGAVETIDAQDTASTLQDAAKARNMGNDTTHAQATDWHKLETDFQNATEDFCNSLSELADAQELSKKRVKWFKDVWKCIMRHPVKVL